MKTKAATPGTIFIRVDRWKKVRLRFSEADKAKLNGAIISEVICPRGGIVDLGKLPEDLAKRVKEALGG